MSKSVRSRVQAAEIDFLRKVRGLSLLEKLKRTDIRQSLNIEPLLLCMKRLQLRWFGHVTRMFHGRAGKPLMDALPSGEMPRGYLELAGGIMLKTCGPVGLLTSWNSTSAIATSCRRSGCFEIPIRAAASATQKKKVGKEKYTKLIQCFHENYDNNNDD